MSTKHTLQANNTPKTPQPTITATNIDDTIKVSALYLRNTQGTLEGIITAFDDITTVLHLIGCGNLSDNQTKALTSLIISHAETWAEVTDGERQEVAQMLGGDHD